MYGIKVGRKRGRRRRRGGGEDMKTTGAIEKAYLHYMVIKEIIPATTEPR